MRQVEKLPRVDRYIFELAYIDGLTNEQIALKSGYFKKNSGDSHDLCLSVFEN